jgi:molybdopterin-guanine dinucleotide biosynthesis protein B
LIASPPSAPVPPASPALRPKAFAIVGTSNSGKTELICRLLEWFGAQGLKAAVLKHSHHQRIGDDGKDTWRYRQAGARLVGLAAPGLIQITRSGPGEPPLQMILAEMIQAADLILVEGYKTSDLPKIGLAPPDTASPLPDYPHLLAWVSPRPLPTRLPVFNPLEVAAIGRFIQDQLGGR